MKEHGQMFDGVELLTLSACKTAAQQADSAGREVDGFAELAQRLGAGAVLASLWAVRDSSTAELMIDFYHKRERIGWSKAEALRSAQRAMIRDDEAPQKSTNEAEADVRDVELYGAGAVVPDESALALKYSHPHYWAPFVLFGNWQ
jgi:CHAT domain-containing protein